MTWTASDGTTPLVRAYESPGPRSIEVAAVALTVLPRKTYSGSVAVSGFFTVNDLREVFDAAICWNDPPAEMEPAKLVVAAAEVTVFTDPATANAPPLVTVAFRHGNVPSAICEAFRPRSPSATSAMVRVKLDAGAVGPAMAAIRIGRLLTFGPFAFVGCE